MVAAHIYPFNNVTLIMCGVSTLFFGVWRGGGFETDVNVIPGPVVLI